MLESADDDCGPKPSGGLEVLANSEARQNRIKVSVFVDIRKLGDDGHNVMMPLPSVVGLHTLDECKRAIGDARKFSLEAVIWKGGIRVSTSDLFFGNCEP